VYCKSLLTQQGIKEWSSRRTKVSFSRTMMQALELLWFVKGRSSDEATLTREEI